MHSILRLLITVVVWVMVTALGIVSVVTPGGMTSGAVFIILMGLSFAYATTRAIWQLGNDDEDDDRSERRRATADEKRKRGTGDTKADMLLALMDDDEREAFKQALQERMLQGATHLRDDGEFDDPEVPLADLLREDRDYR